MGPPSVFAGGASGFPCLFDPLASWGLICIACRVLGGEMTRIRFRATSC
jgi:hypothetical protein